MYILTIIHLYFLSVRLAQIANNARKGPQSHHSRDTNCGLWSYTVSMNFSDDQGLGRQS